ncbi:MAG: TIGR01777 family oxidoreductase, partial [Candidatus Eiseniibacteriota bacterium]
PWTAAHRRRVLESRVRSTSLLAETVSSLSRKPRVFVSASGVGYYGDRGDEVLREEASSGSGFLAEVCRAWEAAATPAARAGIRLVVLRTGMVLSGAGGALPMIAQPFRLGLGGRLGSGRQYMSWIAIDDLVRAIAHALDRDDVSGPLNAVSPAAATNTEFTATLGRVLHRPTPFPVPGFALRFVMNGMADELLLFSQRAEPARLLASGFSFQHPILEDAMRAALARAPHHPVVT